VGDCSAIGGDLRCNVVAEHRDTGLEDEVLEVMSSDPHRARLAIGIDLAPTRLTPQHQPAIDDELARLDASVARSFGDSPDLDRARTADRQGIGGPDER
jgi:hypothetical protein